MPVGERDRYLEEVESRSRRYVKHHVWKPLTPTTFTILQLNEMSSPHFGLMRLLRETFPDPSLSELTCLVGILYEYEIFFMNATWKLPALEPDEASIFLAELYEQNANRLLQRFRGNWSTLRKSATASNILDRLSSHEFVDELAPFHQGE